MQTDQYGGWKQLRAGATGYFRVQQLNGRWWFITPEGHPFIAVGMNHDDIKIGDHNREHWAGVSRNASYAYEYMVRNVRNLNMTAKGYGIRATEHRLPHVESLWLTVPYANHDFSSFPDAFADDFERMCHEKAATVCGPMKDDPYLLGYYLCDCVEWPIPGKASKKLRLNWLDSIKSLGADSPGKQVYVRLMEQTYHHIEAFNAVYGTRLSSFAQLLADRKFFYSVPRQQEQAYEDDRQFLSLLAERFYQVAHDAIRAADPHHLILGEVFEGNRLIPREVLEASRNYTDVLSIQYYGYFKDQYEHLRHYQQLTNQPILLADSSYSVISELMPRPCGPRLASQEERAEAFERYAQQALSTPFVIGWFWCGYMDSAIQLQQRRQHSGLIDAWGRYHEPICSRIRDTYAELYQIAVSRG